LTWLLEFLGFWEEEAFEEFFRIPFLGVVKSLFCGVLMLLCSVFVETITDFDGLNSPLLFEFALLYFLASYS